MVSDCLFCKIIGNQILAPRVYEDEHIIAIRDKYPKAPVHILVMPRVHIESLNDLGPGGAAVIAHAFGRLPDIARQEGLKEGFRTIINTGVGGGQEIFHLHIHVLGGGRLPGF